MTATLKTSLQRGVLALLAGALGPLAFSPVNMWLLGPVSVALLYAVLQNTTPRASGWLGLLYGLGYFGVGVSWVYVSISEFGNAPPPLAALITALLVFVLALFFLLQCRLYRRCASPSMSIPAFAALWVLAEWLRGWLFTGFPWLYLGSAHVTTMFSGLAPVGGVFSISFAIALSGAILGELLLRYRENSSLYHLAKTQLPTALLMLWGLASVSSKLNWVENEPQGSLDVAAIQGNIEQGVKFREDYLQQSLATYDRLSEPFWSTDLVLWPETAIPLSYQNAGEVLDYFSAKAEARGSTLVSGIFYAEDDRIYNSIAALGNGEGVWHKQKLVPFGEYVPLRSLLSNLLQLFALPMSSLSTGPEDQPLLQIGPYLAAPFICYEVVYPDFVRKYGAQADFLLTISNDTWFGSSWGPLQHLQIAAMRARELGRYMLRATNNGVSALIDERGRVIARTAQFTEATLQGEVRLFKQRTPFARWGSLPVLLLCSLILLVNLYQMGKKEAPRNEVLK